MPTDDWPNGRIGDRFAQVQRDLDALEKVPELVAALGVDVRNLRQSFEAMSKALEDRDTVIIQERAANRRALWALTGALSVALITAVASVIAAGITG